MQIKKMRPTRFAHFEGHTDICYTDDGRYMITCGTDGEVRIFEGLDDDDCKTHVVAECASAVAYRDGHFLVGTDSNVVQAYTMDEGSPDGIITRFTAPPTQIVVSKDNKRVACAGSDMTIRVHDPQAYKDTVFTGHQAPVLSVAIDPKGEYLASSSCDGSIRVWDLKTTSVVVSWNLLPKTNNLSSSHTLCRLTWTPNGHHLLVPVDSKVHLYDRSSWQVVHQLSDESIKGTVSVTTVSPCGRFIAAACLDGVIIVWNTTTYQTVMTEKHPKALAVCGLAWNPTGKKELAFVDIDGQFGTVENVTYGDNTSAAINTDSNAGVENGATGGGDFPPLDVDMEEDDDEFSISKIKSQLGFADDEEGTYLGIPKDSELKVDFGTKPPDDDSASILTSKDVAPVVPMMKMPELQKPFQPGMSPEYLNDRYMLWNNVGIVRQYSSEDENSIDVEFHDTSVHHALHLNNSLGHTMAALSSQALAMACESQEDQPSKLVVHHFSAWGSNKEWYVDMPEEEDILAVCLGTDWVAVATDRRNLRIFSTSGIQRDLISIPGPVVCIVGSEDQLMLIFHNGMGVSGDQHLVSNVLSVSGGRHPVPLACPVPLSPRSFLAWAGFSDEGTPIIMDSAGMVRIMHLKYGYNWTSILDTKSHTRGKSDHYFLLGASETQGNLRCILCKGIRYPPVLPKPHVSILNMQIPLCELETEKSELEEKAVRTGLLLNTLARLNTQGYEMDDSKSQADKIMKEAMIKLFALACRSERDSRALEVCQLMPSYHTVELAIKYAGKLRRLQLAERLGEIAAAKMEEELERESKSQTPVVDDLQMYGGGIRRIRARREEEEEDEEELAHSHYQEEVHNQSLDNPLLAAAIRKDSNTISLGDLFSQSSKNPFKKSVTPTSGFQSSKRGIDVIDQFRKSRKKAEGSPVLKPIVKKLQSIQTTLKKKAQEALPATVDKENQSENTTASSPKTQPSNPFKKKETSAQPAVKKQSALQLWLADNEESFKLQYPDATENNLLAKAALMFKDVDNDTKQKYKSLAAGITAQTLLSDDDKKRKREESTEESPMEKKTKGSGLSKLSAFAFSKDS
ncbi:WD repeat and HMG-box DNA-binding protein 1-like [Homarus americanus]|uniref:WD repeat and HMG-box DNA-binding protein 1-like n=1 Tax=Homarus americanus TaxID=6706 RepID=A0A8J5K0V0_HOMAM|nr:WD repeat and HMG-box DNA-binding protein 1-like [Homarus americanus]KAG7162954.1 WD repeat and HMG-box DNA-binding protein 1-like [Homarus americanus]